MFSEALNFVLAFVASGLTYKYIRLREHMSGEDLTDLAYLHGVSRLIDSVEGYPDPHAWKVAGLAEAVGRKLGLEEPSICSLRIAAFLHDCGEMNLPREIFKKKGTLDEEESFILRTHPLLGEMAMRKTLSRYDDVPCIIRWHHERWDGNGYPDRLQGEEIPITARILAVTDAWSAMAGDRPFREPLSAKKIRREFETQSGMQFDPEVVAAWVDVGGTEFLPPTDGSAGR